jgi:hypothetical protein
MDGPMNLLLERKRTRKMSKYYFQDPRTSILGCYLSAAAELPSGAFKKVMPYMNAVNREYSNETIEQLRQAISMHASNSP